MRSSRTGENPIARSRNTHAERPGYRYRADETVNETLDRNWSELLQELRVVQTGVQLLTGFLLTLPFQQRFTTVPDGERSLYLAVVAAAASSTVLLIAPVALHRLLFRQHARRSLITVAHFLALAGSALLGLSVSGVVTLIFAVVAGASVGIGAGAVTLVAVATFWAAMPLIARARVLSRQPED